MTVEQKHQLRIARRTLAMSDVMIPIMGGMDKEAAQRIVSQHETRQREKHNRAGRARHEAYTSMGMKRTPYGYE